MWRTGEQVVFPLGDPGLDLANLFPDRNQRVAEAVELLLRLTFGGLDHQRARYRERDRRRMEAVIDDALRDVFYVHPGRLLERPGVDDAFVGDEPVGSAVEQLVVSLEPVRYVVRAEDGYFGGLRQPVRPHERDVG